MTDFFREIEATIMEAMKLSDNKKKSCVESAKGQGVGREKCYQTEEQTSTTFLVSRWNEMRFIESFYYTKPEDFVLFLTFLLTGLAIQIFQSC